MASRITHDRSVGVPSRGAARADIHCGVPRRRRPSSASCARRRSAWRPRSAASLRQSRCRRAAVRAGDVVAELSALELTASVEQAHAALAAAVADRDHVYAGVRAEEIAALAAEIAKAKSRLDYAQEQLTRASSWHATTLRRSRGSTRRKTTSRLPAPMLPRPKPIMPPPLPARPRSNAPSRMRRSRRRPPRSPCSSGGWTRPSYGRRPTASSA